jgi:hypothetical protein
MRKVCASPLDVIAVKLNIELNLALVFWYLCGEFHMSGLVGWREWEERQGRL